VLRDVEFVGNLADGAESVGSFIQSGVSSLEVGARGLH
jgi:hypothetical protein